MIDLHMHSSASDGSDSIPELFANLSNAGIDTFAVTDHDTIDGAMEMEDLIAGIAQNQATSGDAVPAEVFSGDAVQTKIPFGGAAQTQILFDGTAQTAGSRTARGLRYVKGVEFSCVTPLRKCHLLGYRYDADDPELNAALREGAALRRAKLDDRLAYLRKTYRVDFTDAELAWLHSQKSPGKPHIADLLLKRGIGKSRDDVIQNCIRETKSGPDRIPAQTAISGILHAGGIPVWAHPLGGEGERLLSAEEFESQLLYLIQSGIRGLECHYSRYNEEQVAFLRTQANRHGLLISGGSDYHGTRKTIALGTLNACGAPVCEEQLTILRKLW
ncbi:MAG: PHP domain-containing protein [Lachnospiraceae bacterium]|nr:PHP domain-containing protein [Lachnospiraceae bacterium]